MTTRGRMFGGGRDELTLSCYEFILQSRDRSIKLGPSRVALIEAQLELPVFVEVSSSLAGDSFFAFNKVYYKLKTL